MRNRSVGFIISGFAIILGIITWLYNRALTEIVNASCSHGPTCPMWGSIRFHTNISLVIIFSVIIVGLYFIFFAKDEDNGHIIKKIDKKVYSRILKELNDGEKYVMNKLIDSQGSLFQSDLINDVYTKVKITRILDRLEGKGLIERRRRGMTNVVLLKH
ncbi:MAG: hypothetical protein KatS3mg002_0661 [Candidatus Woesearchaeota archaeon]|nr:MAG: hypothetical protein KatS3mg002_0661 [Candidatus Woesearchaeota archaeon]